VRLSLGYAAARFREGSLDEAVTWAEQAVEEARAEGALAELAHGYYLLHLVYTSLGSPKRVSVRDLALPIYEELGDLLGQANTLNNLGIEAYYEGRWGALETWLARRRLRTTSPRSSPTRDGSRKRRRSSTRCSRRVRRQGHD
jgi:HEPN domain-containing protein